MQKDSFKTKVIFRKFKDNGEVIAFFPEEPYDHRGVFCMSYMHVGQHGGADYNGLLGDTVLATPREYRALRIELETGGYNLDIKTRKSRK